MLAWSLEICRRGLGRKKELELNSMNIDVGELLSVSDDLARAEACLRKYRPWESRLMATNIWFGAFATVLAAGAAVTGSLATEAFGGWRPLCFCVAGLSVIGAIASALHKGMRVTERVAQAQQCINSLRMLNLMAPLLEPQKAAEQLFHIREQYSRVLPSDH